MFWALSTTLFLNMTFHDFGLEELRASMFGPQTWHRLQLLNAAANVVLFLVWSARIWPRQSAHVAVKPGSRSGLIGRPPA